MSAHPAAFDGDVETCPPYLSQIIWELLRRKKIKIEPKPEPEPPYRIFEDILIDLTIYALTYEMHDKEKGSQIRAVVETSLPRTAAQLGQQGAAQLGAHEALNR